jgi:transmembrane protein EpsG
MIYLLYSLFLFIVGFLFCNQKDPKRISFVLLFFAIALFWGLSFFEAADTLGYIDKYNFEIQAFPGYVDSQFEIGYTLLAMIFKTLKLDYWVFQLAVFAVEILLIIKGLRQFYDDRFMMCLLPLLFFIYPSNLAAFRQGMAISIFIFSLHFIYDGNPKRSLQYFLWIIFASFFHQSAVFLILVYFSRLGKRVLSYNLVLFGMLIIGDIIWLTEGSLTSQLDFLIPFFRGETLDMGSKYADIIEGENMDTYGIAKVVEMNVTVIMFTLFCKKDKYNELLRFNLLMYVFVGLVFGGMLAHRLNYYWSLLYYVCFIRGIMSFLERYELSFVAYFLIAAYMLWFFIFKSGYIDRPYVFLFGF